VHPEQVEGVRLVGTDCAEGLSNGLEYTLRIRKFREGRQQYLCFAETPHRAVVDGAINDVVF
jgi:hypothetical protein